MTEKKITKREMYNDLLTIPAIAEDETRVAFIKHEIELLDRKKSSSGNLTPKQKENEVLKDKILEVIKNIGNPVTITDLMKTEELSEYSLNKLNALVTQLRRDNLVVRTYEKRVARFSLPTE